MGDQRPLHGPGGHNRTDHHHRDEEPSVEHLRSRCPSTPAQQVSDDQGSANDRRQEGDPHTEGAEGGPHQCTEPSEALTRVGFCSMYDDVCLTMISFEVKVDEAADVKWPTTITGIPALNS